VQYTDAVGKEKHFLWDAVEGRRGGWGE